MSYVIERNKEAWERAFTGLENKKDLVNALERSMVYATATNGCDVNDLPSPLTNDRELLNDTLKKKGKNQLSAITEGTQARWQLEPLKPDIIGEYFVLDYLDNDSDSNNCKQMIASCWEKPEHFLPFLSRCVRSYLGDFPDLVFAEHPLLFQGAGPLAQALVLFELTTLPDITHCQEAVVRIETLYQEHQEPLLAEIFAQGLFNLSNKQEEATARQTIDELKALSDKRPESQEIALRYANGLVNLSNKQEEATARQTIDELKALSDKRPESQEIALAYAMGLFNLSNKQEEATARQTINELNELWDNRPEILMLMLNEAMMND